MLNNTLPRTLALAALMPFLMVPQLSAQGQANPPPPPGPYQAMSVMAVPQTGQQPGETAQAGQGPAMQQWRAPQLPMPYWMRPPVAPNSSNNSQGGMTPDANLNRSGSGQANNAQISPAAPAAAPTNVIRFGAQPVPGFYPGYGATQSANGQAGGQVRMQSGVAATANTQTGGQASAQQTAPAYGYGYRPAPGYPVPQGYGYPGYPAYPGQVQQPYWSAPAVRPYYPGYQPGYPAPAQVNR
ncbi:MAG TPA: hypothetical protein ENK28_01960 [Aliiroseovarius sp.]|nr:hypothetical protein [Aliiroseovarius sp.]